MPSTIYLIPSLLDAEASESLPAYITTAVKDCQVFFVEDERTARRFLKSLWKEMVIDSYEWHLADKTTIQSQEISSAFRKAVKEGKNIGILSEAGCPGVADPGQVLVAMAHTMGAIVKPLVGPNSILLALMASGLSGQKFTFVGYLPIDASQRLKALKELEVISLRDTCTQIFIETPYRNNQLLETIIRNCRPTTKLCIASNITGSKESIQTKTIEDWRKKLPELHKQPAIFLLHS